LRRVIGVTVGQHVGGDLTASDVPAVGLNQGSPVVPGKSASGRSSLSANYADGCLPSGNTSRTKLVNGLAPRNVLLTTSVVVVIVVGAIAAIMLLLRLGRRFSHR
jgi:undecaprenyl pyrophosphate phosphatase UppP